MVFTRLRPRRDEQLPLARSAEEYLRLLPKRKPQEWEWPRDPPNISSDDDDLWCAGTSPSMSVSESAASLQPPRLMRPQPPRPKLASQGQAAVVAGKDADGEELTETEVVDDEEVEATGMPDQEKEEGGGDEAQELKSKNVRPSCLSMPTTRKKCEDEEEAEEESMQLGAQDVERSCQRQGCEAEEEEEQQEPGQEEWQQTGKADNEAEQPRDLGDLGYPPRRREWRRRGERPRKRGKGKMKKEAKSRRYNRLGDVWAFLVG